MKFHFNICSNLLFQFMINNFSQSIGTAVSKQAIKQICYGSRGWETPYIQITVHKMKKIQSRTQRIIYNDFKWIVSYKIPNHYVVHVKGISYYKSTPSPSSHNWRRCRTSIWNRAMLNLSGKERGYWGRSALEARVWEQFLEEGVECLALEKMLLGRTYEIR